jgi:hypothetical protein
MVAASRKTDVRFRRQIRHRPRRLGSLSLESDLGRAARLAQQQAKAMQKAFEDGFQRLSEAAHDGVEGIVDAMSSLTGLNPAQLGFVAVIAGLREMTKKAIETGDQFKNMPQRTRHRCYRAVGSRLRRRSLRCRGGRPRHDHGKAREERPRSGEREQGSSGAISALGINIKNANGSIRPLDQILAQIGTKFSGYKDGVEKTSAAQVIFGGSGAAMVPLLNTSAERLKAPAAEAKALGYNFEGIAGPSEEFNDNLTRMSKAAVGVGADIARELLPTLISAEERVLDFIKSARDSGSLQMLATGIKFVVDNLDTLAVILASRLAISSAVAGFTALSSAATASAAAFGILEGTLALLGGPVGVVALLAGGVYFLATQENVAEKAADALADALNRAKNGKNWRCHSGTSALRRRGASPLKVLPWDSWDQSTHM